MKASLESIRERLDRFFRGVPAVRRAVVFGSFAIGTNTRRSDLDLIVVMDTDKRFFDRYDAVEGLYGLFPGTGLDILIYTPRELEQIRHRRFIADALERGVTVYER